MQTPPTEHTTPIPDANATLDERLADLTVRRNLVQERLATAGVAADSKLGIAFADLELAIDGLAKAAAVGPMTEVQILEMKRQEEKRTSSKQQHDRS